MNCKEHGLSMQDCKECYTKLRAQYKHSGTPTFDTQRGFVAVTIWPSKDLVAQLATMIYTSPDSAESVPESVALARKICQEVDK